MEEHVLQAVGKVAGIGGLAFGVFLLLFREVIRKNIFPKLSDDEAYRLIRQFMYLTFIIALVGIGAWTYITVTTANVKNVIQTVESAVKPSEPAADISGTWTADVKYSWGDTHHEVFNFEVHGHEITGSATYVTGPSTISNGVIDGNRLVFHTVSYSEVDQKRYTEKHQYKGTLSGDAIEFTLDTDSGYAATPTLKFTAHKSPAK